MIDEAYFELTRSPQFNEVIQLGRGVLEGRERIDDFKSSVKKLNYLRRDMRRLLRYGLRFQEKTVFVRGEAAKIEENLKKLKAGIEETYKYFRDQDMNHMLKGFTICRDSFNSLFASFDALRAEEEKTPPYSESPHQNELMRVGYGVLKGTIKPEAFRERLEMMRHFVKTFTGHFDEMQPNPHELEYLESNRTSIKNTLKSYSHALDEASRYFRDGDRHHIKKGLALSKEASDELIRHQKELMKASEGPQSKLCFKCGFENAIASKYCSACNAALPVFGPEVDSTMELQMDREGAINDFRHIRTEFTEKMVDAVAKMKEGGMTVERFAAILQELEQKALQAQREKARLKPPDESVLGDSADFVDGVEQMMNTGIEDLLEGLAKMRLFLQDGDETRLGYGLEIALSGTDRIYQVQLMAKEMKENADKQKS